MTRLLLADREGLTTLVDGDGPPVVALPGDDMALHRITLTERSGRARRDELLMKVTDLVAGDPGALHVATGPADADGCLWVAVMQADALEAHLARVAAEGVAPAAVVPAALLLPEPSPAEASTAAAAPLVLLRTESLAAAVEPELVPAVAGGADVPPPRPLAELLRGRPIARDALPFDLRQGRFAPPVRWWADRRWQVAAAFLALLAVALALVPLLGDRMREQRIVAAYDASTVELAERALGRDLPSADAAAQALAVARRLREGSGIAPRLSFATATLAAEPEALLATVRADPGTPLTLQLEGPADALNAVARALAGGPFESRQEGRTITLGAARAAVPGESASPAVAEAEARFISARADAAFLAQSPARADTGGSGTERLARLLAAAGLEARPDGDGSVAIAAVRSQVLLPLIADIEAAGLRISSLTIERNDDQTLRASLTLQEMVR